MKKILGLENQLCFALYLASKTLIQLYQPFLKPLDLTYPQYITMLALWEKDQIPVGDLCERLYLDSGTLSPLLKKLECKKLIEKYRDPQDERTVIVSLTSSGHALKAQAECMLNEMIAASGIKQEEAAGLRLGLREMTEKFLATIATLKQ